MPESLEQRLSQALPDMSAKDLHAVAAFAEFLVNRRRKQVPNGDQELSEEEQAQRLAAGCRCRAVHGNRSACVKP